MKDKVCAIDLCKGCGLCQNVCPSNSISLEFNEEGFLYPKINHNTCINCNMCSNECIAINNTCTPFNHVSELFCAQSLDPNNLGNCTSGGIFGELARLFIEKLSGIVYGAVFVNGYKVKHVRAETLKETIPMHYSKYVQSDTTGIFQEVERDLLLGKNVLFSGTPCQIVALRVFLNKEYSNLFCMDVLCYGVMSTYVLRDYIKYVLNTDNDDLSQIDVCFRSKRIPNSSSSFILTKNGRVIYHEPFHNATKGIGIGFGGFFANRMSCSGCEFQKTTRYADITVGDYASEKEFNDFSRSLVIVNTRKGKQAFDQLNIRKSPLTDKEARFSLARISRKSSSNMLRDSFFAEYSKQGINKKTLSLWRIKQQPFFRKILSKLFNLLKRGGKDG